MAKIPFWKSTEKSDGEKWSDEVLRIRKESQKRSFPTNTFSPGPKKSV